MTRSLTTASFALAGMLIAGPVAAQEEWTNSNWGPDDEIGFGAVDVGLRYWLTG